MRSVEPQLRPACGGDLHRRVYRPRLIEWCGAQVNRFSCAGRRDERPVGTSSMPLYCSTIDGGHNVKAEAANPVY